MGVIKELTYKKVEETFRVCCEDLSQEDKDKIEPNFDEIIERIFDFEEVITGDEAGDAALYNRIQSLVEEYTEDE
jgi:hypothetical protein